MATIRLLNLSLCFAALAVASTTAHASELPSRAPASTLSEKQREVRIKHAHELLGRYYKKSSANVGESIPKINSAIYRWTREHLPAKYKSQSGKIAQTIIDESLKHEFDPVFLMSVIEGESSWRPNKVGGVGEIGLMQLRPSTGKWMAEKAGLKWEGRDTLFDPCKNIKLGAAYLTYLRERFDDHARLYLAAYNMGQSNVHSALDRKIWPKDYPIHVMKKYVAFYEAFSEAKVATAKKPTSQMQIVMKPALKGPKKPVDVPTESEMALDVDKLTRSDEDVNDSKDEATEARSTMPDQPGRS